MEDLTMNASSSLLELATKIGDDMRSTLPLQTGASQAVAIRMVNTESLAAWVHQSEGSGAPRAALRGKRLIARTLTMQ
jgi:hypothetical protein